MTTYLVTLQCFISMQGKKFTKFKTKALKHIVQDMKLFCCNSKNMRIHKVVNKEENQTEIIWHLHDHSEHKDVKFTYQQVSLLYWWTKLYSMIKKHCQSCEKCQQCAKTLHNDTIFLTFTSVLFEKIAVNVIKMLSSQNKHYLVIAQNDFSDWVKEWALTHATSATVSWFLWENIITRHNVFDKLICDKESKNKMWVKMLTELYQIDQIIVSAYNSKANDMVKHEQKPLINTLSKMIAEGLNKWSDLLTLILWANQTTIKRSTDWTSYEILYEYACILTIKACISTWSTLIWKKVRMCSNLLMSWAEQLLCHDMNLKKTAAQIQQTCWSDKEHMNDARHAVNWDYKVEDMILLYNSRYKNNNTAVQKLEFWWLESYKIIKANSKKENYVLAELDSIKKADTVSEFRLKPYVLHHPTVNHEYNWHLDAYSESDSSDFNLDNDVAHEQIFTLFVKRQTQKADNDTVYASSDWPSVIKQTFLCNFLKYHNSFFSTVISSFEHNYWQSFFYLILKVFLHTSVRLTLLLLTQLISVTWTVNLFFCHKHCHIMTSNSHMTSLLCEHNFQKLKEKEQKSEFSKCW